MLSDMMLILKPLI